MFRTLAEQIEAIEASEPLDEATMKQGYKMVFGKLKKIGGTGMSRNKDRQASKARTQEREYKINVAKINRRKQDDAFARMSPLDKAKAKIAYKKREQLLKKSKIKARGRTRSRITL